MAIGEAPSEKHSIRNSFEIIPTAPMGPGAPKGPLRCVKVMPKFDTENGEPLGTQGTERGREDSGTALYQ